MRPPPKSLAAAQLLRWKADCLDPPNLAPVDRAAARTGLRDREIAELYRAQADTMERISAIESTVGRHNLMLYIVVLALFGVGLEIATRLLP